MDKVEKAEKPVARDGLMEAEVAASRLFEEKTSDQLYENYGNEPVKLDEVRKSHEGEEAVATERLDSVATMAGESMEDKLERGWDVKEEINEKKVEPKHVGGIVKGGMRGYQLKD